MSDRLIETRIEDTLPLLELFTQLREAGLPLGIDEYKLLLQALQQGFGTRDRLSLKRLCQAVWVKSVADRHLFDYYFDMIVERVEEGDRTLDPDGGKGGDRSFDDRDRSMIPEQTESTDETTTPELAEETPKLGETTQTESTPEPIMGKGESTASTNIKEEVQVGKSVVQFIDKNDEIPDRSVILTGEYFPLTRRQMKQSWRYLRRPIREGASVELDVEATVKQIGQQGMLRELVLVPRRVNRAKLMLSIDRDGSMVPFHALSQRLAETALRGGRLGSADIYYFHNCPIDYLYRDRYHQEGEAISSILDRISERTAVLIFSDGGAARGGYSPDRVELTEEFLEQLKTKVRYIAWLNPMPESRWEGTTAGEIAGMVPMFAVSRSGLQSAINVLRGR